jgi:hypothetical protein
VLDSDAATRRLTFSAPGAPLKKSLPVALLTAFLITLGLAAPAGAATVKDPDAVFLDFFGHPIKDKADLPTGKTKKAADLVKVTYAFTPSRVKIIWTMKAPIIMKPKGKKQAKDPYGQAFNFFIGNDYSTNDGVYIGMNDVDQKPVVRADFTDYACKTGTAKVRGKNATVVIPWSCLNATPGRSYTRGQTVPLMVASASLADVVNPTLVRDDTPHVENFVLN